MKRIDLEKMLMDPEGLKKLAERASELKQKIGVLGMTEGKVGKLRQVEPRAYEERPTPDEIRDNDYNFLTNSDFTANLTRLVTEIEQDDIKKALIAFTAKCKKDSSKANQLYLEDMINRVVSQGELDNESENLVNEAIQVLESAGAPAKREDVMK